MWANLGNVKKEFSDNLKRLKDLRDSARYMSSTEFKKEKPKNYIQIMEEMINFTNNNLN